MASTTPIRREALDLYSERAAISERALARAAYPDLSEGAAQMRLRRRRARGLANVPRPEAQALAAALGVQPEWLGSLVRWVLADEDGSPLAVGGAVYLFGSEAEAAAAGYLLARAGLAPTATTARAVTEREAEDATAHPGAPPLFNAEWGDSSLDHFATLLDVERALRGQAPHDSAMWLHGDAWPGWTSHLGHYARALRSRLRRSEGDEAHRIAERLGRVVTVLHQRADALGATDAR